MSKQAYEGWAIVEVMGHRVRAGKVVMDDGPLIRIDIPVGEPTADEWVTEFYGGSAVFSLRPCGEDVARQHARHYGDPRPVRPAEFREPEVRRIGRSDPPEDEATVYRIDARG